MRTVVLEDDHAGRRTGQTQTHCQHRLRGGAQDAQKNYPQPWRTERFCIPKRDLARFVSQMEVVLNVYTLSKDDDIPLIVMDEASKELHEQSRKPRLA